MEHYSAVKKRAVLPSRGLESMTLSETEPREKAKCHVTVLRRNLTNKIN